MRRGVVIGYGGKVSLKVEKRAKGLVGERDDAVRGRRSQGEEVESLSGRRSISLSIR